MNSAGFDDTKDYTGHTYDEILDKFFAQARFYDAASKRFISKDDIKDGQNWYIYCGNNPVNYIDFMGLELVSIRQYVKDARGTTTTDNLARVATFKIGSTYLYVNYSGQNRYGMSILNVNGTLFAQNYNLDSHFGIAFLHLGGSTTAEETAAYKDPYFFDDIVINDTVIFTDWEISAGIDYLTMSSGTPDGEIIQSAFNSVANCVGNVIKNLGNVSEKLTSLYRAVGPDEFYEIMKTGKFNISTFGMDAKQFGLSFDETLQFANRYSDIGAICLYIGMDLHKESHTTVLVNCWNEK